MLIDESVDVCWKWDNAYEWNRAYFLKMRENAYLHMNERIWLSEKESGYESMYLLRIRNNAYEWKYICLEWKIMHTNKVVRLRMHKDELRDYFEKEK